MMHRVYLIRIAGTRESILSAVTTRKIAVRLRPASRAITVLVAVARSRILCQLPIRHPILSLVRVV